MSTAIENPGFSGGLDQTTEKLQQMKMDGSPTRYSDRDSLKENVPAYPPTSPPRKPVTGRRAPPGSPSKDEQQMLYRLSQSSGPRPGSSDMVLESHSRSASRDLNSYDAEGRRYSDGPMPLTQALPSRQRFITHAQTYRHASQSGIIATVDDRRVSSPEIALQYDDGSTANIQDEPESIAPQQQLQYHHQTGIHRRQDTGSQATLQSSNSESSLSGDQLSAGPSRYLTPNPMSGSSRSLARPASSYSLRSDLDARGRTRSPHLSGSPSYARGLSAHSGRSPDSRPLSYIDLLNVPYPQSSPVAGAIDNSHLRNAVGSNASLLSTKKTLEMYRANVKKTNDPQIAYDFAILMVNMAKETTASPEGTNSPRRKQSAGTRDLDGPEVDNSTPATTREELLKEAKQILQKLADRSYPFAQYYLADGYASGLFTKDGSEDYGKAFPLFVAASKHGHAEAAYRAALCYEFGWGSHKDYAKAQQYYRMAASKNHPGAMLRLGKACLTGDMGLGNRYREGIKWLKRAAESADEQYNSAPYDLGLLHETGYGPDVFEDQAYAAQLFTTSANFGHPEANFRLGDAYEHGKLSCPRDPALSVHYYTSAAQLGHPMAMMALCAWYMVGAEPVLPKDENEAFEWAKKAAESGLPKAQYAVGYFTEMGIGCRRDPLEANVWYVKAADQGDERAKHRLAVIQAAASGQDPSTVSQEGSPGSKGKLKKTPGFLDKFSRKG